VAVLTLRPDSDQLTTDWNKYPTSANFYSKVNEASPDDDSSFVYTTVGYSMPMDIRFGLPDSAVSGAISNVRVPMRIRSTNDTYKGWGKTLIRTGGTDYYGIQCEPPPSYTNYYTDYAVNPKTGVAWIWADIDALQVGIKGRTGTDYWEEYHPLRCTQVYVEVTYTPSTPQTYDVSCLESLGLSDATLANLEIQALCTDKLRGSDSVMGNLEIQTLCTDKLRGSDSALGNKELVVSLLDKLKLTDSLAVDCTFLFLLSEKVKFTDAVSYLYEVGVSIIEKLKFSDIPLTTATLEATAYDKLKFVDFAVANRVFDILVAEAISFDDEALAVLARTLYRLLGAIRNLPSERELPSE
jgi:hypothetical protein